MALFSWFTDANGVALSAKKSTIAGENHLNGNTMWPTAKVRNTVTAAAIPAKKSSFPKHAIPVLMAPVRLKRI